MTSVESRRYNCIAWAAEDDKRRWWWPDTQSNYYWPPGFPRQETVDAFVAIFGALGYSVCDNTSIEQGYDKVAIYTKNGKPTHAARQLTSGSHAGRWTSKMGPDVDIVHDLEALCGSEYGQISVIMRRPTSRMSNDEVST